ncbi:MAG TPA: TetR family transcriptional regulator C-terminal domain-containing protein [Chthoniobacteraceae bacterium]|jgi:hypothetical protein
MESRDRIIDAYVEHLREHGQAPNSVYKFCKLLEIEEREFFAQFPSFDGVESAFWEQVVARVATAVESGAEWADFPARHRLLTFLFAFSEESLNHRSLLLLRFERIGPMARPRYLNGFEKRFKQFAESVIAHGVATGEIADRGRLGMLYPEALYVHFRGVIDFLLKDESPGYERTDAFIEKSVAVAFDVIRTQFFDSAFDLARFLIPRAVWRTA